MWKEAAVYQKAEGTVREDDIGAELETMLVSVAQNRLVGEGIGNEVRITWNSEKGEGRNECDQERPNDPEWLPG